MPVLFTLPFGKIKKRKEMQHMDFEWGVCACQLCMGKGIDHDRLTSPEIWVKAHKAGVVSEPVRREPAQKELVH